MGAQAQLSYSEIRSPIDGVVTDRPLYPGRDGGGGHASADRDGHFFRDRQGAHPAEDAAALKVGDPGTSRFPASRTDRGKVTLVSPALDPNSTTVEVWILATNPKHILKPGTSVQCI